MKWLVALIVIAALKDLVGPLSDYWYTCAITRGAGNGNGEV